MNVYYFSFINLILSLKPVNTYSWDIKFWLTISFEKLYIIAFNTDTWKLNKNLQITTIVREDISLIRISLKIRENIFMTFQK